MAAPSNKVLILDFGSQYTQLIARKVRELGVYSEIQPCTVTLAKIREFGAGALILSGSPFSIYDGGSPKIDRRVFDLGIPVLGICYGMQLTTQLFGGSVERSKKREYGVTRITVTKASLLFAGFKRGARLNVLMSHSDKATKAPAGFETVASSDNSAFVAIQAVDRALYGIQFHPEVAHTEHGKEILGNFVFRIAKLAADWDMGNFLADKTREIKDAVGRHKVILALSGGVDSSVTAVLLHQAIGARLTCIFVDNGLLRKDEARQVMERFRKHFKMKIVLVDASERFLAKLKGVSDPERKRKIIGREFITIFDEEAAKIEDAKYLAQGTLYPDVIESVSFKGPSATIKSHHNVGGLPKRMKFKLIEPMRELFKDEIRALGLKLGIDEELIRRQPFPGPGLGIRIIGPITRERADILREADHIVASEIKKAGLYNSIWQSFAVLLPVKTVGVMGDERTYENVIAVRAVESVDGMTAQWVRLPYEILASISSRIINEVKGVNRVVYDISSKPPSTIEWE